MEKRKGGKGREGKGIKRRGKEERNGRQECKRDVEA